jgi:outer membrane protein assembly factor BamB
MATSTRGGRWMLWLSLALFGVFALLACYHKYLDVLNAYFFESRDASLLEELAAAKIVDEPEPPDAAWSQWRGARRDGVAFEKELLLDWPADGPERLWAVKGGKGYSSFAVFGDRAFTMWRDGNEEVVVCLDLADGARRWRFAYPCTYTSDQGDGPRSTPTLDREPLAALSAAAGPYARAAAVLPGDRLYTVGADGKFHCLDAATGEPAWHQSHDLLAEFGAPNLQWGVAFSPLVEGNLVITTPGGPGASVVAFDKYTGEKKWASQSDKAGYSSPLAVTAAGRRQLLVFAGQALLSLSPDDGALYWRHPWSVTADVNAATPTVFRAEKDGRALDYVFISSGYAKGCALLKLDADEQGKPAARLVYSKKKTMNSHFSSPVRHGNFLYGFNEAELECIDLKTGEERWKAVGFQKGSLLLAGDHLIVLGEKGELALFVAAPESSRAVLESSRAVVKVDAVFDQRRPRCWTMPVLADGKLLLRNQYGTSDNVESDIICLDLRKRK